jgi:Ca2+-binding EF-hand superfamily protein
MLDIGGQLITNATDSNNSLLAIRAWLAKHTDTDSRDAKIGIKHFTALLREFSVLYRPDDVRNLFIEIGSWADKNEDAHRQALADGTDTSLTPSDMKTKQASHLQQLNTCDLMGYLFNLRGAWPSLHERLCQRMAKSMQSIGVSVFIQGANPPAGTANGSSGAATGESRGGAGSSDMGFPKGPKGIETATARRIIARLRAFTGVPASDVTNKTNGSLEDEEEEKMIDLDVFGAICRATGLHLNDEELLLLADSTDRHPLANRINCDVLLDSIASVTESNTEAEEKRKATSDMSTSDKAAKFALKHLGDTLSNAGTRLKRKRREWQKDVTTVMKGFDSQKVGFITTEDFQMALTLLNAKIDLAILRDIPRVPEGPGMVAYQDILEGVFGRSSVMEDEEDGKGKSDAKKPTNTKGLSVAAQRKATLAAMEEEERAKEKQKEASSTAVQALIKVIRKSMKKSAQEQARKRGGGKASAIGLDLSNDLKTRLNKAFKQFDSEDAGVCSPRDFCLAVSVLLDRDEVLLTENQWGEVISFFAPPGKSSKGGKDPDIVSSLPLVDYVRFIKLVMMEEDPAAVSPNKK